MSNNEEWREVRPGLEVSSKGRVRRYIDGHDDGRGYRRLHIGGREGESVLIHQLVAEAFLGPMPDDCTLVRHLNDVKDDNRVENLAYGTRKDNAEDMKRNGFTHWTQKPENKEKVRRMGRKGGKWWAGKTRDGRRGPAVDND